MTLISFFHQKNHTVMKRTLMIGTALFLTVSLLQVAQADTPKYECRAFEELPKQMTLDCERCIPRYPKKSLDRGHEGTVGVAVIVNAKDGTVRDLWVHQSSGHGALDHAATKAIKHWRYDLTQVNASDLKHDDCYEMLVPLSFHRKLSSFPRRQKDIKKVRVEHSAD